ncbi:hypothetical protein M4I21_17695 [Cellulophaga sp. 20_2_10]|uniref:hypothetical protein n=1 Tax=Cellulophaga sp. 20_2_10 TaxID=2942476 RepID=UPI00201AF0C3|nr:hypothetical protein [Cellulophaga sp. 20_2_10]MCL5247655.1 hypothetical protein [Cellulophaga sp. 20_2_10]
MIIGTVFTGQIKSQNGQYIETKAFCFILPIYRTNTLLVTGLEGSGRKGIEIKPNKMSLIASYIRLIVTIPAVFAIIAGLNNINNSEWQWLMIPALILLCLSIYFWLFFGKSTKKETFIRYHFHKKTKLYVLPEWLKYKDLKLFYNNLKNEYKTIQNDELWAEKLIGLPTYDTNFSLYFCLTALDAELNKTLKSKKVISEILEKEK